MKAIRNSKIFAFCQGFYEMVASPKSFGRSHPSCSDWNEAYDRGGNLAEKILFSWR